MSWVLMPWAMAREVRFKTRLGRYRHVSNGDKAGVGQVRIRKNKGLVASRGTMIFHRESTSLSPVISTLEKRRR